ncbi:response regulator transcription factor [Xylophilus sp. GW821-FHT01B05]
MILDDDPLARMRIRRIVKRIRPEAVCTEVASLAQAMTLLESCTFQLALVDIGLPDGNGIELLEWLQCRAPQTETVIISGQGDDATVLHAIRAGAVGYLQKYGDDTEIELSLASLQRGGAPIDPIIARRILAMISMPLTPPTPEAPIHIPAAIWTKSASNPKGRSDTPQPSLSERETAVLKLIAQGCSNPEIATLLFVSINTIECHAKNIYRKLAVHSRSAAVHSARTSGLLG